MHYLNRRNAIRSSFAVGVLIIGANAYADPEKGKVLSMEELFLPKQLTREILEAKTLLVLRNFVITDPHFGFDVLVGAMVFRIL